MDGVWGLSHTYGRCIQLVERPSWLELLFVDRRQLKSMGTGAFFSFLYSLRRWVGFVDTREWHFTLILVLFRIVLTASIAEA